ncbi:MAG: metallophosphoesterase [Alphaproteobacteria bacterium]|jgi:metallophosphoesterase (TIGR00282 family)|nr:metallophosphoesterase [Alphaproteobacteria bacterium]MDF3034008.1 metallophosphoesterase [Alphaproteobacteria bacterium]
MRILFCGDIVGRSGRDAVEEYLPRVRKDLNIDFVIVNAENAAHGFGITKGICQNLYKIGVDVITTGNHIWDQKEIISYIDQDKRLLRPLNYPATTPGRGYTIVPNRKGKDVLVMNAQARLFMETLDDPFPAVDAILKKYPLGSGSIGAIVLDFHGEATSEKMAMGHFCDGRVSLVVGTHTHIPTADMQILPQGTAYQTDAGMCGDYNSVVGMDKTVPIFKFIRKMPTERMQPAQGPGTLCGVFVETDDATGLAKSIQPVRLGARLTPAFPGV